MNIGPGLSSFTESAIRNMYGSLEEVFITAYIKENRRRLSSVVPPSPSLSSSERKR
jgi:hypothetical protein